MMTGLVEIPRRGDVVAIWRRPLGLRGVWLEALARRRLRNASWLPAILGAIAAVVVSWRIQRATTLKGGPVAPNHVVILTGQSSAGFAMESEYDRGVGFTVISEDYSSERFRHELCPLPDGADGLRAVRRAREIHDMSPDLYGTPKYDLATIVLMRLATMLFGPGGASRIRSPRNDGRWICSEFCADAWEAAGVRGARERFVVPADFLKVRS